MIKRFAHLRELKGLLSHNPVVTLLGARQVGKPTLTRELARSRKGLTHFFDLESTADLSRLADPLFALSPLRGLVVLDEIQGRPDLFPTLRVLCDRPRRSGHDSLSANGTSSRPREGDDVNVFV